MFEIMTSWWLKIGNPQCLITKKSITIGWGGVPVEETPAVHQLRFCFRVRQMKVGLPLSPGPACGDSYDLLHKKDIQWLGKPMKRVTELRGYDVWGF